MATKKTSKEKKIKTYKSKLDAVSQYPVEHKSDNAKSSDKKTKQQTKVSGKWVTHNGKHVFVDDK